MRLTQCTQPLCQFWWSEWLRYNSSLCAPFSPFHYLPRGAQLAPHCTCINPTTTSHNMSTHNEYIPPCSEFTEFQDWLTLSRRLSDDNLVFTLNKTNGSAEQCGAVWDTLVSVYNVRQERLKECIRYTEHKLENEQSSTPTRSKFSHDRRQLSWLKSSLSVEEILHDKSIKQFKMKCPGFVPILPQQASQQPTTTQPTTTKTST